MEDWRLCQKDVYSKLDEINEQITLLRIEVAELKIKSGIWGFTAGLVSVLIMVAVEMFFKH